MLTESLIFTIEVHDMTAFCESLAREVEQGITQFVDMVASELEPLY